MNHDFFKGAWDKKARMEKIREADENELFTVQNVLIDLPPEAEVVKAVACERCGEFAMKNRTRKKKGRTYCLDCYEKVYIESPG